MTESQYYCYASIIYYVRQGLKISHAWIKPNDLKCKAEVGCGTTSNDPCFGCCYNYPDRNVLTKSDYIVIQCSKLISF